MLLGNLETCLSELPGAVMQRIVRLLCAVKCRLESATKRGMLGVNRLRCGDSYPLEI